MKIKSLLLKKDIFLIFCIFIITVPAFLSLFNNSYFTMHDDQHIVRLYLLDQGIRQWSFYPRWVDVLGFGFGYPLFNFYPPLIYYVGEVFHLLGASYIWSIKLMIMTGFVIGAVGMYLFTHKFMSRYASLVTSTLFTYFGYRAATVYVRGAFAEFFAMSILPFVFLSLYNIYKEQSLKNSIYFGVTFALLILAHPLIAAPAILFIGLYVILNIMKDLVPTFRTDTSALTRFFASLRMTILGLLLGLGLSAFFWLPSLVERKHTLIDTILLRELANYALHFVYPMQFWWSPWGYGGSIAGPTDGISFALGKIYIGLTFLFVALLVLFFVGRKKSQFSIFNFQFSIFFLLLLFFSLFMTTPYSKPLWDNISYLHYLQFPWRFLTFTAVFISLVGGVTIEMISNILSQQHSQPRRLRLLSGQAIPIYFSIFVIITVILVNGKYFRPQQLIQTTDRERTSYEEIAWRISRSSFEFAPRDVQTTQSELGTTVIDITKDQISRSPYEIIAGKADVELVKNNFDEKVFIVRTNEPTLFRLNTFNFPGWKGTIVGLPRGGRMDSSGVANLTFSDDNPYRLITIQIPQGDYEIKFRFTNTSIRTVGNIVSLSTLIILMAHLTKRKSDSTNTS